jgi:hypothetical protein
LILKYDIVLRAIVIRFPGQLRRKNGGPFHLRRPSMDIIFQFGPEMVAGGSDAYVHRVNTAHADRGTDREIAACHLPSGQWVISAKAVLVQTHKEPQTVHFQLRVEPPHAVVAGQGPYAQDNAYASATLVPVPQAPPFAEGSFGSETSHFETVSLMLGVDLKGGGRVRLAVDCQERMGFIDIVISAIKVKSLTLETV